MSVREQLHAEIERIVDGRARVLEYEDSHDDLDVILITLKQRRMAPLEAAPRGALRIDYVITITAPATLPENSERVLDEFVPGLLIDLGRNPWFGWVDAVKVLDGTLAYDVDVFIIASTDGDAI